MSFQHHNYQFLPAKNNFMSNQNFTHIRNHSNPNYNFDSFKQDNKISFDL